LKISLLSYTPEPLKNIYLACRTCYSKVPPSEISDFSEDKIIKLIKKTLLSGHHSVLEHAVFTFSAEGVSRALTHQLVRHRLASYAQQSQRYVEYKAEGLDFVVPDSIKKIDEQKYNLLMQQIFQSYREFIELGIPAEDARYVLPNATTSNILITMNYRELINFCHLRLCFKAQWEIREMSLAMKKELHKVSKFIASNLMPKCQNIGYCEEDKPCGHYKFSQVAETVKKERAEKWDM